ncbi:hypothetical protein BU14_0224s0022 [Porphyra umbilicalis]|uniref:Endonuclease/exonuclease/phosphatase domain-containing protein n=1 Tax=Porphyra umbilicalis TaxID=2786 RepID=A0A1X6P4G2_PORUM|nr:hypothetical protein BU14_0224s0022 [Porphyra umbilicalis]|eukprot:OSX75724.1 hypothetical protein BU14_0224s0022 [Porphyra umbilicalis]
MLTRRRSRSSLAAQPAPIANDDGGDGGSGASAPDAPAAATRRAGGGGTSPDAGDASTGRPPARAAPPVQRRRSTRSRAAPPPATAPALGRSPSPPARASKRARRAAPPAAAATARWQPPPRSPQARASEVVAAAPAVATPPVASWNVASLRTVLRNGTLAAYVAAESPDVLCVQETRLHAGGWRPWCRRCRRPCPTPTLRVRATTTGRWLWVATADAAVVVADDADAAVGGAPTGGGGAAGGVGAAAAGAAAPPPPRKGRLGYSGTALLCKVRPLRVTAGFLPAATRDGATAAPAPAAAAARVPDTADGEGRVLTAEFADLVVVGVYVPNAGAALVRLPTRVGAGVAADGTGGGAARGGAGGWDARLRDHVAAAAAATGKHILLAGDCNCAHAAIDLSNPRTNERNAGFTPAERRSFSRLVGPPAGEEGGAGRKRLLAGGGPRAGARAPRAAGGGGNGRQPRPADEGRVEARRKNVGWRLDYVLATPSLATRLLAAWVRTAVVGSDHAPVGVTLMASLAPPPPPPRA